MNASRAEFGDAFNGRRIDPSARRVKDNQIRFALRESAQEIRYGGIHNADTTGELMVPDIGAHVSRRCAIRFDGNHILESLRERQRQQTDSGVEVERKFSFSRISKTFGESRKQQARRLEERAGTDLVLEIVYAITDDRVAKTQRALIA